MSHRSLRSAYRFLLNKPANHQARLHESIDQRAAEAWDFSVRQDHRTDDITTTLLICLPLPFQLPVRSPQKNDDARTMPRSRRRGGLLLQRARSRALVMKAISTKALAFRHQRRSRYRLAAVVRTDFEQLLLMAVVRRLPASTRENVWAPKHSGWLDVMADERSTGRHWPWQPVPQGGQRCRRSG